MDTDGCSMYAIKVEREITETGTGESIYRLEKTSHKTGLRVRRGNRDGRHSNN